MVASQRLKRLQDTLNAAPMTLSAPLLRLGTGVLVGALPPASSDAWTFRTAAVKGPVLPPSGDGQGLRADMEVWPLLRAAKSQAGGVHSAVLVGRSATNDVMLDHPSVSKLHARVVVEGGEHRLEDSGSSNGVQVNGQRLDPGVSWVLTNGDVVTFGGVFLTFFEGATLLRLLTTRKLG